MPNEEIPITPDTIPHLSTADLEDFVAGMLPIIGAAVEELQRRYPGAKLEAVQ